MGYSKPITIPYSPLPGSNGKVYMPMVPVTLISDSYEVPTFGLVDSGADGATISTVLAESLGIDWTSIPSASGTTMSGSFIYHRTNIDIDIYGEKFEISVCIAEAVAPFKCILGEADLFQRARISFEREKGQFSIELRELN